ncbi:MAG: MarR family winged helix-turn-helix transcriptional regulator [Amylibacter sp.]|nr:MarR family winged helix-turn-helix transcriptional regulator [Amylibacter sp.]
MHDALIPHEQIDDFFILRARAFTSKVRRMVTVDVLQNEDLQLLEWQLLFSVARFGSCHLAFITRSTSIDPAHGSRAASALENKGLITRREDPQNRRRKLISMTSKGIEVFERIWPNARMAVKNITDHLDPVDFAELKRLMDLLNKASVQTIVKNLGHQHSIQLEDEKIVIEPP